jgi:hypothetical protein
VDAEGEAEVDVLVIGGEVRLVEAPDGVPGRPLDEETTGGAVVDITRPVAGGGLER